VGGYHLAFWVATGVLLVAAGIAATVLRPARAGSVSEQDGELASCAA
jgi:hypothetical protein